MNLVSVLDIPSALTPDSTCLHDGQPSSFAQTQSSVTLLASRMRARGIREGDIVALVQEASRPNAISMFAALYAGATVAPLNFRMRTPELASAFSVLRPRAVIADERYLDAARAALGQPQAAAPVLLSTAELGCAEPLPGGESPAPAADRPAGSPAILLMTSGTTGTPKTVRLSHGALFADVTARMAPPAPDAGANLLCVPTYHVAGVGQMLSSIYAGRTLRIMRAFSPREWLDIVEGEHINFAFLVPTMLRRILDEPDFDKRDLKALQLVSYGAAPASPDLIAEAIARFPEGCGLSNAYGQTETRGTMTVLTPDDHSAVRRDPSDQAARDRLRSVGRPIPGVTLDILDPATGTRLTDGQTGEVAVTREGVPARTRTGDLGYLADGYLFLVGRASDRIIRGGENIDPAEVEDALGAWPQIAESAVVGQPDPEWGETVTAFVVPRCGQDIDEAALREHMRSRLASFKCPDRFIVQSELPRNSLGKIQRAVLRVDLEEK